MKYISYMITCGGDAGWRFSNGPEWCSMEYILLFDAEKWDVDRIAEAMRKLWHLYWAEPHASFLSDTMDRGFKHIIPFINDNDGVYVWKGRSFGGVNEGKVIDPNEEDVTYWEKDGCTINYNYDK